MEILTKRSNFWQKDRFGNTGDTVTVLGYGAMELRHVDASQAERLLNSVLDAGINYIDTAPDYGPSEDLIGNFIAHRRSEYIPGNKMRLRCSTFWQSRGRKTPFWTGEQLLHNIEHSLKRLKTDYVDVWQIHSAYPEQLINTDVIETMQNQGVG